MTVRSDLIDTLIEKAQNRIFLDVGSYAAGGAGWSILDWRDGAEVRHSPMEAPWPLEDQSVFYIRCLRFLQHIPHACLHHPRDPFIEIMEECWRVLLPEGKVWITVPYAETQAAWGDPTNRRVFVPETFKILNRTERRMRNIPDDYTTCNFIVSHGFTWDEEAVIRELHVELYRPEEGDR